VLSQEFNDGDITFHTLPKELDDGDITLLNATAQLAELNKSRPSHTSGIFQMFILAKCAELVERKVAARAEKNNLFYRHSHDITES